jgi:hypothetical protein
MCVQDYSPFSIVTLNTTSCGKFITQLEELRVHDSLLFFSHCM